MAIMEMETAVHPSDDKLGDFFHGRLPADEAAVVEEHLADCERCCLLVENVPGDSFMGRLRAARALPSVDTQVDVARNTLLEEPGELANHPRYRVIRPLGRGGMGAVYLAEHLRMGRSVALKVINPELLNHANALSRFQQEVKAAAKLDHPNIVAAYDADQAGSLHFLVMEYVEGQNLADYLNEKGPLPIAQACDIIRHAALGLQHAHERGMVHRDIKPHNLMLTPTGQVKVLDFGLARFAIEPNATTTDDGSTTAPHLTGAGAVMGSADYIAPEQAQDAHSADGRSDIYSLGCTLYHLLTGRPPFPEGTAPEKLQRHSVDEPRPLSALRPEAPDGLAKVIAKVMAKKPEDRYQTAADVATALSPFTKYVKPRRFKIGRALLALAGLALVGFALVVGAGIVRIPLGKDREIVIETDAPDIQVVVQGDRIVRIVDPKTGKAYRLNRDNLTLGLVDDSGGLEISLDDGRKAVLKRDGKQIAVVWAERKGAGIPVPGPLQRAGFEQVEGAVTKVSDSPPIITPLHRIPWPEGNRFCCVDITADGRYFLASRDFGPGKSSKTRIWDTRTGALVRELPGFVGRLSSDGTHVITNGGWAGDFHVHDLATGKEVRSFETKGGRFWNFWLAADGTRLYNVTARDHEIYDWATGKLLCRVPWCGDPRALLTPDGRYLLTQPSGKPPLRVLDAATGKDVEVDTLRHLRDLPKLVGISADGNRLLCDGERREKIFDVAAGKQVMDFEPGIASTLSGNGRLRLSSTERRDDHGVWDVDSGRLLARLQFSAPLEGLCDVRVSCDGRHAVLAGPGAFVYVFRLPEPPAPQQVGEVRRFTEGLQKQAWRHRAAFTADGQGVYASSGAYPLAVMHWDRHTGALISQFDIDSSPNAFSLSPDRKLMVFSGADGGLQVAEAAGGKLLNRLEGANGVIWCSALNRAANRVAVGDEFGKVYVWDHLSGKLLWSKQVEPRAVRGLAISPDGATLAVGGNSPWVLLCETGTGKELRRLKGDCIECAFSRDGKRLVAAGGGEVLIWDLSAGKVVQRIGPLPAALDAMALAPDEKHLATGTYDGMVRWWDMNTGAELHCFHAHPGGVLGLAVSPDGKYLLSSGKDGTVRLWRLPDSPAPAKLQGGPVEKRLEEAAKSNNELAAFLKVCEAPHPSLPEKFGAAQEKPGAADYLKLQGAWTMTSVNGPPGLPKDFPPKKLVIVGDQFVQQMGGKEVRSTFKLNPQKDPKEIDLYQGSQLGVRGIYRFKGDEFHLLICVGIIVGEGETAMVILDRRPAKFTAQGAVSMGFKRLRSPDSSAEELKQPLPGSEAARPALPAKDARATGPRQIALEVTLAQMEPAEARRLFGRQTKNDPLILGVRNDKAGQMLRMREKAKILAEAHLVALNGRPGKFTSGGIVVDFLPIVLDNGKIHLEVCPEISVPDAAAGVRMGGPTSALVPGFKTQRAEVTAQLEDGQTLVIEGLAATARNAKEAEQELVILATPRLEKTSTVEKAEPGEGGAK